MKDFLEMLSRRKMYLMEQREQKQQALLHAPGGSVRMDMSKGKVQFYYREDPREKAGIYIPKERISLAQNLIQKEYDQKVLRSIEQELKAIEAYLARVPQRTMEEVYETLRVERQKFITPVRQTDEQYIRAWEEIPFRGKEIDSAIPPLYTEKGERVRSKSEVIIADVLHREGIPYKYECPLMLKGWGKVHPDFTTLNVRKRKVVYWEHLGMMDDAEYVDNALTRYEGYEQNGIVLGDNLILTFETRSHPLNQRTIRAQIERYLR